MGLPFEGGVMAYQWQPRECNAQGIPYSKLAGVYLEKEVDSVVVATRDCLTQEETDAAWADGFHEPHRPETRDVPAEPMIIIPSVWVDAPTGGEPETKCAIIKQPRLNKRGLPDKRYGSRRANRAEFINEEPK